MGKLLCFFVFVFIFSVFSMPIYGGLGIVVVFEVMIITVFLWTMAYSRTEYTEFNLKKIVFRDFSVIEKTVMEMRIA